MHCGPAYPDEPPTIQFVSQINLPCVNPRNGIVDPKQLPCLANWQRNHTMETVLIELRRYVGGGICVPATTVASTSKGTNTGHSVQIHGFSYE
jgi:ubiquitin-protein ligase